MNVALTKMKKTELIALIKKMEKSSDHPVIGELTTLLDSLKVKDAKQYDMVVKAVQKVITDAKPKEDTGAIGYKKLLLKVKDNNLKVILDPDTQWGKAFYKACNKMAKKYGEKLVSPENLDKDITNAYIVLATAFKDDILSQIGQKEFDKVTNSEKQYKLNAFFEEYIFTENDEYSELIVASKS